MVWNRKRKQVLLSSLYVAIRPNKKKNMCVWGNLLEIKRLGGRDFIYIYFFFIYLFIFFFFFFFYCFYFVLFFSSRFYLFT